MLSKLKKTWEKTVSFLSRYAKRAHPNRDEKTGRLQYGLSPITS
jgi:hypothetical protein